MSKYQVIYADPPWWYNERGAGSKFGSGASKYKRMKYSELAALRPLIDHYAAQNCVMFMWITGPRMDQATRLMAEWGFRWATGFAFAWIKMSRDGLPLSGPGYYTGSNIETVALGVRGSMPPLEKLVPSVVQSQRRGEHSTKPEEVANRIERMYPEANKIELFARRTRPGWDCMGLDLGQELRVGL